MQDWKLTITLLKSTLLFAFAHNIAETRTPWFILKELRKRGAYGLDEFSIQDLGSDYNVPDFLRADVLYDFLEHYTNTGCDQQHRWKYAQRKGGVGGRVAKAGSGGKRVTHVAYLFGEGDGGLYGDMSQERADLQARLKSGERFSQELWRKYRIMGRLLDFIEAKKKRLSEEHRMVVTVVHIMAYLRPRGASCHRDTRLDSPRSRRAILCCPSSGTGRQPRLSFFVGQKGSDGRLDRTTARCFGKCDGNVLFSGQGSGGFPLVPAAVDGLGWYLWHWPWSQWDERSVAVGGDGPWKIQASIVFSGHVEEEES